MIKDIIPAAIPRRGLKILTPETDIIDHIPAVESHISFLPFVNFLKEKLATTSGTRADFFQFLIRKFEEEPALLERVSDIHQLDDHEELLEFLSTAIFPIVSEEGENNFTLSGPYQFNIFNYSETFRRLFVDPNEEHFMLPADLAEDHLKQVQCAMIYDHVLEKYYGIKLNESPELVIPVTDKKTAIKRYFRIKYDRRFIELNLKGKLPPIQDCAVCLNTFRILDLEQQLKTMPLELFEAEGFAVWVAEDVTVAETLDQIKKTLLVPHDCGEKDFIAFKRNVKALTGLNDIEIGLMPLVKVNDNFILHEDCTRQSLMGKHWRVNDEQSIQEFRKFIDFQKENPEPMPVTLVDEKLLNFAPFLKPLYDAGVRSYIYYPMQNSDGLLGMLELASTTPNTLDQGIMARLEPAVPLLSLAMLKSRDAFDNKIEKLVKEKFTALQPSVEWKFSEVAWEFMQTKEPTAETGKICFTDVFPLYGAVDIRNSSIERSSAIQKDLKEHLQLVDQTLDQLQSHYQLTLLEELKYKCRKFQQSIEDVLFPEDEVHLKEYFMNEVNPVFTHLQQSNEPIKSIIDHFFQVENNCQGPLYHYRNDYEATLATINQIVSNYFEEQDELLQRSYPHYFEKYRTDGVEYNIYIGQSMAPGRPFDMLYLKNLRLWQLQSMAEVAKITYQSLPSFKVPLETTELVLIYSTPVSIQFRKDERRFDVEGSYNLRYEIMKKRIDKAFVKGSQERLTQPGKIALVYSNLKEAQEYEQYIHFLQSKDLLKSELEYLELEEMQGLKGLKGLRVAVNLE